MRISIFGGNGRRSWRDSTATPRSSITWPARSMVSESTGGTTISAAPGGETSPLTWYGRLGVWLGAFMLLLQSVTGRGAGVTTVVAVAALTIGLTVFLAGLASA